MSVLQEIFRKRDAEEWLVKFHDAGIPAGPVHSVDQALNDPHTRARQAIVELEHSAVGLARSIATPIKMSGTPIQYRYPPPLLGEHTAAILAELEFSADDIRDLRNQRAIE